MKETSRIPLNLSNLQSSTKLLLYFYSIQRVLKFKMNDMPLTFIRILTIMNFFLFFLEVYSQQGHCTAYKKNMVYIED